MSFGHSFKEEHFAHLGDAVSVNHGLYGLPPKTVIEEFHKQIDLDLAFPDLLFRVLRHHEYVDSLKVTADFLKCDYQDLGFVDNATTGVNAVLRSLPFVRGDKIAMASTTYGACANTVRFLAEKIGIEVVVVELAYPLLDAEVVKIWSDVFASQTIKLALFDTVVSMPGLRVPYVELTNLCREKGVLSMVDGAHLIGLIPLDFTTFKPDFFTSNLHKWLFVPRGCAVLYVAKEFHRTVQTLPVSHLYVPQNATLSEYDERNLFVDKFLFTGSKTLAAISCVPAAFKFRSEVCGGEEKINEYCYALARTAGAMAEKKWPGAKVLENEEGTLSTAMVTVILPVELFTLEFDPSKLEDLVEFTLRYTLSLKKRTFVPFAVHNGKLVCRLSAQIYNEPLDYQYAYNAADDALRAYFKMASLKL